VARVGARGAWTATLTSIALAVAPVMAQTPPASVVVEGDREAQRTQLYKQAVELANAGRWGEAADTLGQVLAIRSSAKVRFTFGQAEEHVGRLASAYDAYAQALADGEAAGEGDVAAAAGSALHGLAPRVPVVRVMVTGASSASATAAIDGRGAPPGQLVRVDPGSHRVAVQAPGARSASITIEVVEGQRLDVPVHLEGEGGPLVSPVPAAPKVPAAEPAAQPAAEAATASASRPWRIAGVVTAGVGAIGLGIGTYFGLDAISKNNTSNSSGCTGNACTASAYGTREDARSAATASTVMFVAGGMLAAGGVSLWLLAPRGETAGSTRTVQVTPAVLATGGGLRVAGVW
jgi:hypothetical protein